MDPAAGPRAMGGVPWEPPWPGRPQPLPHHLQRGAAGTRQGGTPRRGSPHAGVPVGGLAQRSERASWSGGLGAALAGRWRQPLVMCGSGHFNGLGKKPKISSDFELTCT